MPNLFAGWKERYKVARIIEESNCGKVATGRPIFPPDPQALSGRRLA
ncbi:hypothetical protein LZC95_33325 [Pendulispora brunnea]|uniref:Uncharacterized protein n=1 Tax=Pendulispora brunnea TaxID=2905690 RepID=A0ABZ2K2I3_9BACT